MNTNLTPELLERVKQLVADGNIHTVLDLSNRLCKDQFLLRSACRRLEHDGYIRKFPMTMRKRGCDYTYRACGYISTTATAEQQLAAQARQIKPMKKRVKVRPAPILITRQADLLPATILQHTPTSIFDFAAKCGSNAQQ